MVAAAARGVSDFLVDKQDENNASFNKFGSIFIQIRLELEHLSHFISFCTSASLGESEGISTSINKSPIPGAIGELSQKWHKRFPQIRRNFTYLCKEIEIATGVYGSRSLLSGGVS